MLDLKLLQKQPEVVAKALADRHSSVSVEEFQELDARRRAALTEVETLKAQLKKESGDVARLKRAGQDASELVARLGLLSDRIKELDQKADDIKEQLYQWMHEKLAGDYDEMTNLSAALREKCRQRFWYSLHLL